MMDARVEAGGGVSFKRDLLVKSDFQELAQCASNS